MIYELNSENIKETVKLISHTKEKYVTERYYLNISANIDQTSIIETYAKNTDMEYSVITRKLKDADGRSYETKTKIYNPYYPDYIAGADDDIDDNQSEACTVEDDHEVYMILDIQFVPKCVELHPCIIVEMSSTYLA